MRSVHSSKHLWAFFALTFAWSWTCWGLSPAVKTLSPVSATLLMFAGSFGPSLAAVVMVANGGGRVALRAWLSRCMEWQMGWPWLAFALLFPLAVMSAAAGLHLALGGSLPTSLAAAHPLVAVLNFFLVLLIGGPLGEEFGWRAYALPRLQQHMGWRMASVCMGVVWGAWHVPLFFIAGTSQAQIPMALFLLSVVAMSVLFACMFNRTNGSVVAALALHTSINFWPSVVPVLPTEAGYRPYAFVVAILVATALWLLWRRDVSSAKKGVWV
jgi:uncharacterized protein